MTQQQRDALDQLLRDAPLDLGGDVAEQRVIFEEMMAAIPSPADVTTSSGSIGGILVVNVAVAGADHASVIFYLHGGRTRSERPPHPLVWHRTSHAAREPGSSRSTTGWHLNVRILPRSMTPSPAMSRPCDGGPS